MLRGCLERSPKLLHQGTQSAPASTIDDPLLLPLLFAGTGTTHTTISALAGHEGVLHGSTCMAHTLSQPAPLTVGLVQPDFRPMCRGR